MSDSAKILEYFASTPEEIAQLIANDPNMNVVKLSAALANALLEIRNLELRLEALEQCQFGAAGHEDGTPSHGKPNLHAAK